MAELPNTESAYPYPSIQQDVRDVLNMCIKTQLQKIKEGYKKYPNYPKEEEINAFKSQISRELEKLKAIKSVNITNSDGKTQTIILWGPGATTSGALPRGSNLSKEMQRQTELAVADWIDDDEFDASFVKRNIKALIKLIEIKRDNSSSLTGAKKIHEQTLKTLNELLTRFNNYNFLVSNQVLTTDKFIERQVSQMTLQQLNLFKFQVNACFSDNMPNAAGQFDELAKGTIIEQITKIDNKNKNGFSNDVKIEMNTLLAQLSKDIIALDAPSPSGGRRTKRRKSRIRQSVKKMRPKRKKQNTKMNKQRRTHKRRR